MKKRLLNWFTDFVIGFAALSIASGAGLLLNAVWETFSYL